MRPPRKDAPTRTVDQDGVIRTDRGRSRPLAWALAIAAVVGAVAWLMTSVRERPAGGSSAPEAAIPPTRQSSATPALSAAPAAEPDRPGRPDLADDEREEIFVDQIEHDPASGEKDGIHLFNRPGTKPIRGGLLVPEGFVLPPGYMRHYQATDDGEPVGPILVFHPDHQPVDAAGRPVPMPPDRIVPPELAPPGMPLQALDPPAIRRDLETPPPR